MSQRRWLLFAPGTHLTSPLATAGRLSCAARSRIATSCLPMLNKGALSLPEWSEAIARPNSLMSVRARARACRRIENFDIRHPWFLRSFPRTPSGWSARAVFGDVSFECLPAHLEFGIAQRLPSKESKAIERNGWEGPFHLPMDEQGLRHHILCCRPVWGRFPGAKPSNVARKYCGPFFRRAHQASAILFRRAAKQSPAEHGQHFASIHGTLL